ncbi:MAG: carboxypeptidase [candidate division Zixibacteria bacterium]|nr:carboxypeptidase [candidate division Zixibacteria bacterium]
MKAKEIDRQKDVQVIQLIRTNLLLRGAGKPGDPYRRVEQFWSDDGFLIAENDPIKEMKNEEKK